MDLQGNSGQKQPLEVSSPTSCAKQRQLWGQTRLLRAWSSQVLKTSKDRAGTGSLGNLLHSQHKLKSFCLYSVWTSLLWLVPVVSYPVTHHCEECISISSVTSVSVWAGGCLIPHITASSPGWTSPGSSDTQQVILMILCWTCSSLSMSVLDQEAQNRMQYSRLSWVQQ